MPCPTGRVGEIWVRGPSIARGYFERSDATKAAFDGRLADSSEGPFLRTGDLGFIRGGQLFVTGRLKDLIIIRGRNYYPEDIEWSAERACEGLRLDHCAAFSLDGEDRERLVIVQEVEPRRRDFHAERAIQAVRRAVGVRHGLEVHAVVIVKAGNIPKTSSGKTRRSACRDRYLASQLEVIGQWKADGDEAETEQSVESAGNGRQPVTAGEIVAWLTRQIASRLRLPQTQVGATTPFIEFGMSSINAVEMAADLERWLGRPLSPTAIYNHPTIAALADWLVRPSAAIAVREQATPWTPAPLDQERLRREVEAMTEEEMKAFLTSRMPANQERAPSVGIQHSQDV